MAIWLRTEVSGSLICPWDPGSCFCSPVKPQTTVARDAMWNLWKNRSQNHPAKPPLYSWLTETVWGSKPYCFKLQSFYQYSKQKFYSWWRDGEGRACALKTPSPQRKGNNESFLNWSIVDLQSCTSFRCIAKWFSYIYVCVCVYLHMCVCFTYIYACVPAKSLSNVQLFETPWTIGCQVPLSMRFCRQEYGVGCHVLLQRIFLTQESNSNLLWLLHFREILYCRATWEVHIYIYIQIHFPYRLFQNI